MKMGGEGGLKRTYLEGKLDGLEESDKPKLVKLLPCLGINLDVLGRLMGVLNSPKRQLRAVI